MAVRFFLGVGFFLAVGFFLGVGKALDEQFALTDTANILLFKQLETESAHSLGVFSCRACVPIAVCTLHVFLQLLLRRAENKGGLAEVALERGQRLPLLRKIDRPVDIFTHSMVFPHMILSLFELHKEAPVLACGYRLPAVLACGT